MKFSAALFGGSIVICCLLALSLDDAFASGGKPVRASANIIGCNGEGPVGFAFLRERKSEEGVKVVRVTVVIKGLITAADGKHAVHIHETAACEPCGAAQGHFDPGPNSNTSPDGNHPFHSGDLINIELRDGNGLLNTLTTRVTLSPGPLSLFDDNGSAFIVHVNPDTYCPDGAMPGCAGGARAACGIIELLH